MFIAEVIPRAKLPRKLDVFDYVIPSELEEKIQVGSIVAIPFRKHSIEGVVARLKTRSDFSSLKSIEKVFEEFPEFREDQLKFLQWIAEYYAVSPALALKSILPEVPKRAGKKKEEENRAINPPTPLIRGGERDGLIKGVITPFAPIVFEGAQYIRYATLASKFGWYEAIVKKAMAEDRQILFVSPTFYDLAILRGFLGQKFPQENTVVFSVDASKGSFYETWLRVVKKEARIILGTRSAIFAPIAPKSVIVIDEEAEDDHKQREPNPRYDSRTAAMKLAGLLKGAVFFSGRFPRVEAEYAIEKGLIQESAADPLPSHPLRVINMRDEFSAGRYGAISDPLAQLMVESLAQKKQCVLFLNRRGMARAFVCRDCKRLCECGECGLLLSYHKAKKPVLVCHHCEKEFPVPLTCPHCKGTNMKEMGKGTEKIAEEAKKLFPEAKVLRLDADTDFESLETREKEIRKADIIIGTSFVWPFLSWERIGCVAILSLESMLAFPDFRINEKALALLLKLRGLLAEYASPFPLVIQTFTPEHSILEHLKKGDAEDFYAKELEERKLWGYPPLKKNILLLYQGLAAFPARKQAEKVYAELARIFANVSGIAVSPPQPAKRKRVRGNFRYAIFIKCDAEHLPALHRFFKTLEERWIVDVDPQQHE